jgi:hypothetical protein
MQDHLQEIPGHGRWPRRTTRNRDRPGARRITPGSAVTASDAPPDPVVDRVLLADELARLPESRVSADGSGPG